MACPQRCLLILERSSIRFCSWGSAAGDGGGVSLHRRQGSQSSTAPVCPFVRPLMLGALADEAVFENFSERGLNVSQGLTLEGRVYPGLES